MNTILLTDGYKLDHRRQYPNGTEYVYSTWIPRSNKWYPKATDGCVVFGIQYFIKKYLIEDFNNNFFNKPKEEVLKAYKRRVDAFLGPNNVGVDHIGELHDLGYLPLCIKALPEGTVCPIHVPCVSIINTDPKFYWLTNYIETMMSCLLWLPMTSATTARLFKKALVNHARKTGFEDQMIGFNCHDFSMRGMGGIESAIISGMGHLTSFTGTDSLPSIEGVEKYYNADCTKELIAMGVPATEHAVMEAGGNEDEFETFKRLITEVYPTGIVSIVSDTWDYWQVITDYLPRLKDTIINRNGRVVIRPDSGEPVHIICGYKPTDFENYEESAHLSKAEIKGSYEMLWDLFGGTINENGYKVLDPHIGLIYGDSITLDRQEEIYNRLEEKGFAATNLVLGIGSFSYQLVSRDNLGFAQKASWCQINGEAKEIFKNPKTDSGMKKSLKGLAVVYKDNNGKYYVQDQVSKTEEGQGELKPVFVNGVVQKDFSLEEIRNNVNNSI